MLLCCLSGIKSRFGLGPWALGLRSLLATDQFAKTPIKDLRPKTSAKQRRVIQNENNSNDEAGRKQGRDSAD